MQCESVCTNQTYPFHAIGVNDLGMPVCMECGGIFTKRELEKNLEARFGSTWPAKYRELIKFKVKISRRVRSLRRKGCDMAETVYFIDPPINPELHKDHIIWPDCHIKKPNGSGQEDSNMPRGRTVWYLGEYGTHG